MPEEQTEKKPREIPTPVKLAQEALDILQAEGAAVEKMAELNKLLPLPLP